MDQTKNNGWFKILLEGHIVQLKIFKQFLPEISDLNFIK